MAGIARENVSRILNDWIRDKLVSPAVRLLLPGEQDPAGARKRHLDSFACACPFRKAGAHLSGTCASGPDSGPAFPAGRIRRPPITKSGVPGRHAFIAAAEIRTAQRAAGAGAGARPAQAGQARRGGADLRRGARGAARKCRRPAISVAHSLCQWAVRRSAATDGDRDAPAGALAPDSGASRPGAERAQPFRRSAGELRPRAEDEIEVSGRAQQPRRRPDVAQPERGGAGKPAQGAGDRAGRRQRELQPRQRADPAQSPRRGAGELRPRAVEQPEARRVAFQPRQRASS